MTQWTNGITNNWINGIINNDINHVLQIYEVYLVNRIVSGDNNWKSSYGLKRVNWKSKVTLI